MVNMPIPESLGKECQKAARTLRGFTMPDATEGPDKMIPPYVIAQAKGLVIMTVVKAGFLFSGRVGFGLVVARLPNGTWSAPSAVGTGAFGAGLQIGVELTDFVIVLNSQRAVDAFTSVGNLSIGGNMSIAAGPIGRNAEAAGTANLAALLAYSKTKGLFVGVSLEGTAFVERRDTNSAFYGKTVSSKELLTGVIPPPEEAKILYQALRLREHRTGEGNEGEDEADPNAPQDEKAEAASAGPAAASAAGASTAPRTAPAATAASAPRPAVPTATKPTAAAPQSRGLPPPPPVAQRPPPAAPSVIRAKAMYDFAAQQAGDLGFSAGDVIEITEKTDSSNDWWKGKLGGKTGSFPANYVQLL